jgi:CubicO group peptidase (beta-lactamase class C family)
VFDWGGYHTTHFWIDPKNELYAIFMCRRYPYNGETLKHFRKAVYESLISGCVFVLLKACNLISTFLLFWCAFRQRIL